MKTLFLFLAQFDLSGIVALITLCGGVIVSLVGIFIKQIKDNQEIRLTVKRDKQETDRELELIRDKIKLLELEIEVSKTRDEKMYSLLAKLETTGAVTAEKINNLLDFFNKKSNSDL